MEQMVELAVYFEVWGLGETEAGQEDWAGVKLSLGKVPESELPNYDELVGELDKGYLLEVIGMKIRKFDDLRFITKEEYEERYGDDEDDYDEYDE